MSLSGQRLQPGDRADRDYRAAPSLLDQDGCAGLERPPDAAEVHVEHQLPLLFGHLPEPRPRRDAGVGNDDVKATELGDAVADGGVQRRLVAHVRVASESALTERLHVGDRVVELGEVRGDDVGAVRRQRGADCAPEPARGAGD